MRSKNLLTLQELVQEAHRKLPQTVWDYLVGGAETETTVRRNRQAIESLAFRPRVLTDVANVDTSASLLGHSLRMPVLLPPIGSIQVLDPRGAEAVAEAAEEFGTLQFVSSAAQHELEQVAAASTAAKVYQLYLFGDRDWMDPIVRQVIEAGYVGFCLTVDTQVYSRRERDWLKRWTTPSASVTGDFTSQSRMTWDLVKWFKDRYEIPLILKGIATAEDAALACEHGVDVVYVSNHGGRQLDHSRGALDALPEVVAEARGKAEIVVDGGFLRGTDVVKGIALGADVVAIGRSHCFGLAADGAAGVVRVLEILEHEIQLCLALLGVTSPSQLGPQHVVREALAPGHRAETSLQSAFPLLDLPLSRY